MTIGIAVIEQYFMRVDTFEQKNEMLKMRKRAETAISDIKKNVSINNTCSYT